MIGGVLTFTGQVLVSWITKPELVADVWYGYYLPLPSERPQPKPDSFESIEKYSKLNLISGIVRVDVINKSHKTLTDVFVRIEDAEAYAVPKKPGRESHISHRDLVPVEPTGRGVRIATMAPYEEATVFAWVQKGWSLWSDSSYLFLNEKHVRVIHSAGVAELRFYRPVVPFWGWWAQNWDHVLFVGLPVLSFIMFLGFIPFAIAQEKAKQRERVAAIKQLATSRKSGPEDT